MKDGVVATDVLTNLATEAEMAGWGTEGLPSDRVSCENGAILTTSERWCLMIDPQLQGITWIKNRYRGEEHDLQVTRMGQAKMVQMFEVALEHGKPVLVENMAESVEAVLSPVIGRQTSQKGAKEIIKLGDKEIICNIAGNPDNKVKRFLLVMQTKLANPHYSPEIQAETTLVNFTVTEAGLEDQLLFLVVKLERPDLAATKAQIITDMNMFKVGLAEKEATLLDELAKAEGDLTENVELILLLEDTEKEASIIKGKMIDSLETQRNVDEISEVYRPAAKRGALFFFMMMDLRKMHSFYKYSLDAYIIVVTRAITAITLNKYAEPEPVEKEEPAEGEEGGEGGDAGSDAGSDKPPVKEPTPELIICELIGKELTKRVQLLTMTVSQQSFNFTRRGLFDAHKLLVASLFLFRIMQQEEEVDQQEVKLLFNCPPDPTASERTEAIKELLTEFQWGQLKRLEEHPYFAEIGLCANVESDFMSWKRYSTADKPEIEEPPKAFRDASAIKKLMLLKVIRPDRCGGALQQMVIERLGSKFITQDPFDMVATFDETSNVAPVFFVLFPGTDPTPLVEGLGKNLKDYYPNSKNKTESNGFFVNISMGQGQENVATAALDKQAQEGGWVFLQNIHLMQGWLPTLERALEKLEEPGTDPEFRCFLSSEPPSALYGPLQDLIREGILQRCLKIADEAPSDLKSTLKRAYAKFEGDVTETGQINIDVVPDQRPAYKAALYGLCFFHAVVLGRRQFGPQGFSRAYPFNDGDLQICGMVLKNYLNNAFENDTDVPWPDLRYVFGEIMYGGHITDPWDRRVTNAYLSLLIKVDLMDLSANMMICPGLKSPDSTKLEYADYKKLTETKFPAESPKLFGMHENTEVGMLQQQGAFIFKTFAGLAGGGAGGGVNLEEAKGHVDAWLVGDGTEDALLPAAFDMMVYRGKIREMDDAATAAYVESVGEVVFQGTTLAELVAGGKVALINEWLDKAKKDPVAAGVSENNKPPPKLAEDPYVIVGFQEADRMNVLLKTMKSSLIELDLGVAGALNVTDAMEALAGGLNSNSVPAAWAKYAWPCLKDLQNWGLDLNQRCQQLRCWLDNINRDLNGAGQLKNRCLTATWMSGFFNAMAFITAIMQVTARANKLPLDDMVIRSTFTNSESPNAWVQVSNLLSQAEKGTDAVCIPMRDGQLTYGYFMEGAGWELGKGDSDEGYITDAKLKELRYVMPMCHLFAIRSEEYSPTNMFIIPIFYTSTRGATFVCSINARMDPDDFAERWIIAGAALLLQPE
jgi:dynein heavy chain